MPIILGLPSAFNQGVGFEGRGFKRIANLGIISLIFPDFLIFFLGGRRGRKEGGILVDIGILLVGEDGEHMRAGFLEGGFREGGAVSERVGGGLN
jgi:hypothetical protein